jgi:hypothetical protein
VGSYDENTGDKNSHASVPVRVASPAPPAPKSTPHVYRSFFSFWMRGDKKGRCGHSYLESTRAFLKAPQKIEATIIKECVFQHPKSTRIGSEFEDFNTKTLLNANKYFIPL